MTVFHLELFASRFFPSHSFCQGATVFFGYLFASHVFFPVHCCKMTAFHLELFASHVFRPIHFSKMIGFFSIYLLPIFSSQSIFVS